MGIKVGDLDVSFGRSVVVITGPFDKLFEGEQLRARFKRSYPGSDWGADGIGYLAQKNAGAFRICRSGVGPREFKRRVKELTA